MEEEEETTEDNIFIPCTQNPVYETENVKVDDPQGTTDLYSSKEQTWSVKSND